jgi:hypothetical protein
LQLGLAGDQINGRGESSIRALIGNLGRQINRYAERHAENIQEPKKGMPPQITQNVPAKDAKIL